MVSVVRFDRWQNTAGTQYANVIQSVFVTWTDVTSFTTANTYQTLAGGTLTITPKLTGSKLLVFLNVQGYYVGTGGINVGLNRTLSGTTTRIAGVDGSSGDSWAGSCDVNGGAANNSWTVNRYYMDTPGTTVGTPVTYTALGTLWSSGTFYANYTGSYGLNSNMTIWEIQP